MINKVTLVGYLGKDPELRQLESGSSVAQFSVATSENYKDKAGEWQSVTEWHNVVCWRALAERVEKNLKKGNLVYIEGKISTRKWQDKEGNDRYSTDIIANTYRKLEKREESNFDSNNNFPTVEDNTSAKSSTDQIINKTTDVDDDLPF